MNTESIVAIRCYLKNRSPKVRELCELVLTIPEFATAPGGATRHHIHEGGLAEHTMEVLHECWMQSEGLSEWSKDILYTAAVFHDVGKIHEYTIVQKLGPPVNCGAKVLRAILPETEVKKTEFARLVGHLSWSWMFFIQSVSSTHRHYMHRVFDELFIEQVSHCMLAHHGRRAWGSPVEPETREAFILHHADMLSMKQASGHKEKP